MAPEDRPNSVMNSNSTLFSQPRTSEVEVACSPRIWLWTTLMPSYHRSKVKQKLSILPQKLKSSLLLTETCMVPKSNNSLKHIPLDKGHSCIIGKLLVITVHHRQWRWWMENEHNQAIIRVAIKCIRLYSYGSTTILIFRLNDYLSYKNEIDKLIVIWITI